MTGSERASVEAHWRELTGARQIKTPAAGPAYIRSLDGHLWKLFRSRGLPLACEIVVRSEALAELEAKAGKDLEELDPRKKNSLLSVIAVLCSLAKINYTERGAGTKITGEAHRLGIKIDGQTVLKILKDVPEAVERRKP